MKLYVLLLAILFNAACNRPPDIEGELCTPDWENGVAKCSKIKDPDDQYDLPIEQMLICVNTKTWKNIDEYVKNNCK